ncbi:MAG: tetratricopeptide repeat protein [Planctomycetota bacterium]|jgi:tetratricopeptide (TPR) repeat protein
MRRSAENATRSVLLLLAAVLAGGGALAGEAALSRWHEARERFRRAGKMIAEEEDITAGRVLDVSGRRLPAPYGEMARAFRRRLTAISRLTGARNAYRRKAARARLCAEMGCWEKALELARGAVEEDGKDPEKCRELAGWCLLELGRADDVLREVSSGTSGSNGAAAPAAWRARVAAAIMRRAKFTDPEYIAGYVRAQQMEARSDWFAALEEIRRVTESVSDAGARRRLARLTAECLSELGDTEGSSAWLKQAGWGAQRAAEARVARATEAYREGRREEALAEFRAVCRKFPESVHCGVALYNAGVVLKDLGRHDAAIAQFEKLIASKVKDREPGAGLMQRFRNYRHQAARRISECWEAKRDHQKAYQWAMSAKFQYSYQGDCGGCLGASKTSLDERIRRLRELTNRAN